MTVQELIQELEKIENKNLEVEWSDADPFCGGCVRHVKVTNIDSFGNVIEPIVELSDG